LLNTTLFLIAFLSPGNGGFPVFCGTFFFFFLNVICCPGLLVGSPAFVLGFTRGDLNIVDVVEKLALPADEVSSSADDMAPCAAGRDTERHRQQLADAMFASCF
jgi:hypothetical protein